MTGVRAALTQSPALVACCVRLLRCDPAMVPGAQAHEVGGGVVIRIMVVVDISGWGWAPGLVTPPCPALVSIPLKDLAP